MRRCFVWLFVCLSKLGLRDFLQRSLAFYPPKKPTYTLRAINQDKKKRKILPRTRRQIRNGKLHHVTILKNQCGPQDQNISIKATEGTEATIIRLHAITSFVSTKQQRPYKLDKNVNADSFKTDRVDSNSSGDLKISFTTEFKIQNGIKKIKPLNPDLYPTHELKLINFNGDIVEISEVDELYLTAFYLKTRTKNTIPCLVIQPVQSFEYCIIYSHPNSSDLGLMIDNYLDLAYNLGVVVIGYDYTGYGQASGKPSDINAIADIEAVYNFATQELGFQWKNIILYGQSIGSGPSVTLASNQQFPIAGLIIHSGLASGLRIIDPNLDKTYHDDIFPNIDLLQYVNCLVYIFHGQDDSQIPHISAETCAQNVKNLYRVWLIEEAGHNNIEYENKFRQEYFSKLRQFLRDVKDRNQFYKENELLKLYTAEKIDLDHLYKKKNIFKIPRAANQISISQELSKCPPQSEQDRTNSNYSEFEMTKQLMQRRLELEKSAEFGSSSRRKTDGQCNSSRLSDSKITRKSLDDSHLSNILEDQDCEEQKEYHTQLNPLKNVQ